MIGIAIAGVFAAGFLVGGLISAALGALAAVLVGRDAKRRRHAWWMFALTTALLSPCALMLVHSRPATVNLPYSVDMKNLFLNSIGYGGSLGVAAAVACAVTLIIPRPKRTDLSPPIPKQDIPPDKPHASSSMSVQ